jgi:uncharacterized protein YecE (DUF72 family)
MRFFVGTSGYSYKEWKGSFYPEKLPQKEMLAYYAQHFSTCEINNTFYRMPRTSVIEAWGAEVPDGFRFVLKASQRITHIKLLKDVATETDFLIRAGAVLKEKLGALLFQLPPNLKKDLPRLESFLDLLPKETKAAFEFRHESWLDEEVFETLRKRRIALCVADTEGNPPPGVMSTAGWGYVRLRSEGYSPALLKKWIQQMKSQEWDEAYVFFKHEDTGTGPELASKFLKLAE